MNYFLLLIFFCCATYILTAIRCLIKVNKGEMTSSKSSAIESLVGRILMFSFLAVCYHVYVTEIGEPSDFYAFLTRIIDESFFK